MGQQLGLWKAVLNLKPGISVIGIFCVIFLLLMSDLYVKSLGVLLSFLENAESWVQHHIF